MFSAFLWIRIVSGPYPVVSTPGTRFEPEISFPTVPSDVPIVLKNVYVFDGVFDSQKPTPIFARVIARSIPCTSP